jgi:two-component sensor histidine kinase
MLNKPSPVDPTTPASRLRYVVELIVIAIVYAVVAKASLALASINPSASPIWPPTGFALACTLLWGYRVWPAILFGAFIVNATTTGAWYTSLAIGIGNTCESFIGAYLINRWSEGIGTFDTPAGVGRFAAICFFPSTAISATLGVLSLSLAGFANWANFVPIWLTWWMGDLAGALLIAPVIVLWAKSPPQTMRWEMLARSGIIFATAAVIGLLAFSPFAKQVAFSNALAFLSIVPLMWAALRHGQRDTATTALILACFAVWGAISGAGPFMQSNINDAFLLLLAFMISISIPSLALSANAAAHDRDERRIETVMLELSHRSKNLLAVIQSIARQVARRTKNFEDFDAAFSSRIRALADVHDLLVMQNWEGAPISEVIRTQMAPFAQIDTRRLTIEGPELMLKPKAVEHIGLALHELATNATKYGALSIPEGSITIHWTAETDSLETQQVRIEWKESGGPTVSAPYHKGFGHMVVMQLVPKALEGNAQINYSTDGLGWTLQAPAANVIETASGQRPSTVRFWA